MDRHFAKALLFAWERPEFRAGVQHLIDLDEVTALLAALADDDHDRQVEYRVMEFVRSALDTDEIRDALLLTVESDDIRGHLAAGITDNLPQQPDLARSIHSALDDPKVRQEIRAALATAQLRDLVWKAAENQFDKRRWALLAHMVLVFVRHRSARRLVWALKRHGVLRELRRSRPTVAPPR
jgi:hypothetical protein